MTGFRHVAQCDFNTGPGKPSRYRAEAHTVPLQCAQKLTGNPAWCPLNRNPMPSVFHHPAAAAGTAPRTLIVHRWSPFVRLTVQVISDGGTAGSRRLQWTGGRKRGAATTAVCGQERSWNIQNNCNGRVGAGGAERRGKLCVRHDVNQLIEATRGADVPWSARGRPLASFRQVGSVEAVLA